MLATLLQDSRYALRSFGRNPGFALVACASIAIGIAANTTIFSMANAALFGDMPVREPQRLMTIVKGGFGATFSWPDYKQLTDLPDIFESASAHFPLLPASIGGEGRPERVWGQIVTSNYFASVGVPISQGRGFIDAEGDPGRTATVLILSHALWTRRFAADPAIVGKTVSFDGAPYQVVGVSGKGFHGTERGLVPDFFIPMGAAKQANGRMIQDSIFLDRHAQWVQIDARLKPGVSRERAIAALNVVNARIEAADPKSDKQSKAKIGLIPSGGLPGGSSVMMSQLAMGMMAVVGLVLLIACANVANLLLSRATARTREMGMRLALGANRGRLVRQLLTESVLLSLVGAAGGIGLTFLATRALNTMELPIPIPIGLDFRLDLRVFVFTAGLAIVTGVLFGLLPALRATKANVAESIRENTNLVASWRRFGLRQSLVVLQVSFCLVLLIGAGLFLRSLRNASSIRLGFDPKNVLVVATDPSLNGYSEDKAIQFRDRLRTSLLAMPGVKSVAFTDVLPLNIAGVTMDVERGKKSAEADEFSVGPGYFETLGIPLLRGRDFARERSSDQTVAVITEALAKKLFGNEDPVGQMVSEPPTPGAPRMEYRVIGVVADSKSRTIGEETRAAMFKSLDQGHGVGESFFGTSVLVKTTASPEAFTNRVKEEIWKSDRFLPIFGSETLAEHVDKALLLPRLTGTLFGVFGGAGLLLASCGLFGVMSFGAKRRTREIGIRMALGATKAQVSRMVAKDGVLLVVVGLVVGGGISFVVTRVLASMLYGITPTDPVTWTAVCAVLAGVSLVAIVIPARKAAGLDPMAALRHD